jgi:hypothetical protein
MKNFAASGHGVLAKMAPVCAHNSLDELHSAITGSGFVSKKDESLNSTIVVYEYEHRTFH